MLNLDWVHKFLVGNRGGTVLWKVPLGEIDFEPISDPAEGVAIATLAENILKVGLLQPLLLWKCKDSSAGVVYQLIAGRRRLEALRMLGKTHASAVVVDCEEEDLPLLALSDNLMRREMGPFLVAENLERLISSGHSVARLSRLLGVSSDTVERYLAIRSLTANQQRMLKLCGASVSDVAAFMDVPDDVKDAVLQRVVSDDAVSIADLVRSYRENPLSAVLQSHKIWSADIRLFANTVERGIQTMQRSGLECEVTHRESEDEVSFMIRFPKASASGASDACAQNVSRETFWEEPYEQISLPFEEMRIEQVFRASLAEAKSKEAKNVSRETFLHKNTSQRKRNQRENAEKLEMCIDEIGKR